MRGLSVPLLSLLFAAAAVPARAETPVWKKVSYPADGFEAEFPGDVKAEPTAMDEATKPLVVRSTTYLNESATSAYAVGATLYVHGVNLDNGATGSFGAFKCKTTTSDKPLKLAGGSGRELNGTDCENKTRVEAQYFAKGKWFYQVITLFNMEGGDEAAARRFLKAFKITGP